MHVLGGTTNLVAEFDRRHLLAGCNSELHAVVVSRHVRYTKLRMQISTQHYFQYGVRLTPSGTTSPWIHSFISLKEECIYEMLNVPNRIRGNVC